MSTPTKLITDNLSTDVEIYIKLRDGGNPAVASTGDVMTVTFSPACNMMIEVYDRIGRVLATYDDPFTLKIKGGWER